MRTVPPRHRILAALAGACLVLSGCAQFDGAAAEWDEATEPTPRRGPEPPLPEAPDTTDPGDPSDGGDDGGEDEEIPPPDGCTDFHPAVIGTCMDTVVAVAALPTEQPAALAGERDTGTVWRVEAEEDPAPYAELDVNSEGDGGLTGLALSPTYHENGFVFAYLTTDEDNRVVRFAKGEDPQPILTGIPKGSTGNAGALALSPDGTLLIATGDAGDPDNATDEDSLAGKVLRMDHQGDPAPGNPDGTLVIASGLRSPGGLCVADDASRVWVTDRGPDGDAIYLVKPGRDLGSPTWRWPDRPGVAGCADTVSMLAIATSDTPGLQVVPVGADGTVTEEPKAILAEEDVFGLLGGVDVFAEGVAVVGTVNSDGGDPVSSDDRVFLLPLESTAGGGGKE